MAKSIAPVQIVSSGDMSGDVTSTPLALAYDKTASIHFVWSGTPTGSWVIYASNRESDYLGTTNTWVDVTSLIAGTLTTPAGSASQDILFISQCGCKYLKVKYTRSGSTGTLNVYAFAKGL